MLQQKLIQVDKLLITISQTDELNILSNLSVITMYSDIVQLILITTTSPVATTTIHYGKHFNIKLYTFYALIH